MSINRGIGKKDVVCVYTHTHTHTHTVEYYSAIKKSNIGSLIEVWINLESVIQNEVSQKEKHVFLTDRSSRL